MGYTPHGGGPDWLAERPLKSNLHLPTNCNTRLFTCGFQEAPTTFGCMRWPNRTTVGSEAKERNIGEDSRRQESYLPHIQDANLRLR